MCAGGSGYISEADNLDSGFHPSGVGAKLKRAAVRWPRVAYAASGAHYHTWFTCGKRGRVGSDDVIQGALEMFVFF